MSASITVGQELGRQYRRKKKWRESGVAIAGELVWQDDGRTPAPVIQAQNDSDGFLLTIDGGCYRNGLEAAKPVAGDRVAAGQGTWLWWDPETRTTPLGACS